MQQFGDTMQLSCNPASPTTGFVAVNGGCPEAFGRISLASKANWTMTFARVASAGWTLRRMV